ncbi:hypothetical protein EVAR_2632_1 [Eumeta japonica]|uniref:Uncharacterized protein n=1 Tax=Eumeta variegata TaxID=151549 RepID=A0A4C1SM04_EUMVA|nr:hypothetical protein EVAR_2632_1 [Eumeta japonica]
MESPKARRASDRSGATISTAIRSLPDPEPTTVLSELEVVSSSESELAFHLPLLDAEVAGEEERLDARLDVWLSASLEDGVVSPPASLGRTYHYAAASAINTWEDQLATLLSTLARSQAESSFITIQLLLAQAPNGVGTISPTSSSAAFVSPFCYATPARSAVVWAVKKFRGFIYDTPRWEATALRKDQLDDPEVSKIINGLENTNDLEVNRWAESGYHMCKRVLYCCTDAATKEPQLIVPENRHKQIMVERHNSAVTGHGGIKKTLHRIS